MRGFNPNEDGHLATGGFLLLFGAIFQMHVNYEIIEHSLKVVTLLFMKVLAYAII